MITNGICICIKLCISLILSFTIYLKPTAWRNGSVHASSVTDHGFDPRSGLIKYHKIYMFCFACKTRSIKG